jgi:hypothetical protein
MVLKEHHCGSFQLVKAEKKAIEEKKEMDQRPKKRRTLKVKRTFEPGHLSQASLVVAYERIVPKYGGIVYVMSVKEMCEAGALQKEKVSV